MLVRLNTLPASLYLLLILTTAELSIIAADYPVVNDATSMNVMETCNGQEWQVCNWSYTNRGTCNGICNYCAGNDTLTGSYCFAMEGLSCSASDNGTNLCQNGNQRSGQCMDSTAGGGTMCHCNSPQTIGPCNLTIYTCNVPDD